MKVFVAIQTDSSRIIVVAGLMQSHMLKYISRRLALGRTYEKEENKVFVSLRFPDDRRSNCLSLSHNRL